MTLKVEIFALFKFLKAMKYIVTFQYISPYEYINTFIRIKLTNNFLQDKIALVKDLSILAREDRTRRQHLIHKIPTNLFQPVQQQLEDKERHQFELEDAFEKIIHKKIHVPITSE
jgi:hypothetical protein